MESFFLYLHLISALFYFIKEILLMGNASVFNTFLFILYLILTILPVIFESRKIKLLFYGLPLPGIAAIALVHPQILFLLPLPITRILALFTLPLVPELFIYFLPVFLFTDNSKPTYLFYAGLAYCVLKTVTGYENLAKARERKIDNLEYENQELSRKICRLEELDKEKEFFYKLEERSRITQKLHDELGHTITGSIVQLEAVNTILRKDPEKAGTMVAHVSALLNSGMHSIRRSLKSLKPETGEAGLQHIKSLLGDFEKNSRILTRLKVEGNILTIPAMLWQVIIRNLKEALTNILKHSNAGAVYCEILVLNKIIKAGIKDNGMGARKIIPGMGLSGIDERTREAGGTLILDGSDGFSLIMVFKKGEFDGNPGFNRR